jgi:hypothetical protein
MTDKDILEQIKVLSVRIIEVRGVLEQYKQEIEKLLQIAINIRMNLEGRKN